MLPPTCPAVKSLSLLLSEGRVSRGGWGTRRTRLVGALRRISGCALLLSGVSQRTPGAWTLGLVWLLRGSPAPLCPGTHWASLEQSLGPARTQPGPGGAAGTRPFTRYGSRWPEACLSLGCRSFRPLAGSGGLRAPADLAPAVEAPVSV